MNTYIMYLDRTQKIQEYLHNAHRQNLKSVKHYNKNLAIQCLIRD